MNLKTTSTALLIIGMLLIIVYHFTNPSSSFSGIGVWFAVIGLFAKILLASTTKPATDVDNVTVDLSLGLALPFYNEDPKYFSMCLESISAQTRLPDVVWLIDDCSTSNECYAVAAKWAEDQPFEVQLRQLRKNVGKRHGQAVAYAEQEVDVWMTCDSDTVLDVKAIEEGMKPLADPEVHGVAGLTMGYNWNKNLLTRLIDLEFVNSFLIGRSALSRFGSVLVSCGAIAFYRSTTIMKHIDDYLNETFMGSPIRAGDDRKLTQYCLLEGKMVYQETAQAYSALPEKLGHLVRQRIRWSASFYRAIWWMYQNMPKNRLAFWMIVWQVMELVLFAIVLAAFVLHVTHVWLPALVVYFAYMTVISYIRSIRYLGVERHDMSMGNKIASMAISPLISVLYTFVLTPVRYYSMLKVRENKWGTRQTVEVSA